MTDTERAAHVEHLMNAYGTGIKRFCALQLGDRTQAEDVAQEVFIKAWRALDSFRGECNERTWLTRIAVNACRDYRRTGWFRFVSRGEASDELPDSGREEKYPDGTVSRAVTALPWKLKTAVLLRYYEELTLRETAGALRVSEATVKRWLKKANERLRCALEGWYCDE